MAILLERYQEFLRALVRLLERHGLAFECERFRPSFDGSFAIGFSRAVPDPAPVTTRRFRFVRDGRDNILMLEEMHQAVGIAARPRWTSIRSIAFEADTSWPNGLLAAAEQLLAALEATD